MEKSIKMVYPHTHSVRKVIIYFGSKFKTLVAFVFSPLETAQLFAIKYDILQICNKKIRKIGINTALLKVRTKEPESTERKLSQ